MITAECQQELTDLLNGYAEAGDYAPDWLGAKIGDSYEVIAKQEIATGRWSRWDLIIVRGPLSSLWGFEAEDPLTEYQEIERPDSYEVFPIDAIPSVVYVKAA